MAAKSAKTARFVTYPLDPLDPLDPLNSLRSLSFDLADCQRIGLFSSGLETGQTFLPLIRHGEWRVVKAFCFGFDFAFLISVISVHQQ